MVETVKPFEDLREKYFPIHNYVFDVCMPALSNSGWRILCVAIRNTLGWSDKTSFSGRRKWDRISYSQFMEASGLRSASSVSKGIQENLKAGYIVRRKVGTHQGTGRPLYAYCLNQDYEAQAPPPRKATTESVAEELDHNISTPKSGVDAAPENEAAATPKTGETKTKGKQTIKENDDVAADVLKQVHMLGINGRKAEDLVMAYGTKGDLSELVPRLSEWLIYLDKQPAVKNPIGLAIRKAEEWADPPRPKEDDYWRNFVEEQDRRRYIEGKYADIIEH